MRWPGGPCLRVHRLSGLRVGEVRVRSRDSRSVIGDSRGRRQSRVSIRESRHPWLELHRARSGASYIGITPTRVLNTATATGMGFWSLNPYVGCEFGCAYCYARETHQWVVERAATHRDAPETAREAARFSLAEGFERRILVKVNTVDVLERTLDPDRLGTTPIVIGSATDPYQPAERRFGVTRQVLEFFLNGGDKFKRALRVVFKRNRRAEQAADDGAFVANVTRQVLEFFLRHEGLHLGIITKSALIERDAALIARLCERHVVSVHFSVGSLDHQLLRQLEPRSATPQSRLRVLRRLADLGVSCDVLIMPILPGLTDDEAQLRAVVQAARHAGAEAVAGGAVRMGPATRNTLMPWLERHRPALAERYRRHFSEGEFVSREYNLALKARLDLLREEAGFAPLDGGMRERRIRMAERHRPAQGELF